MSALNQTLLTVVEIMLIVTLPLVALAALQHLRLNAARLKNETVEGERKSIKDIVKMAVSAAEQTGVLENLIGPEKKEYALEAVERYLRQQGINVDVKRISDYIEAEVLDRKLSETPLAATAASGEQQALINNAVETAVLAAEQSGLKGFISNVGTEKKSYATQLATQFLEANGVKVDPELLSGLIEGQLMKLLLAARGQLPASK